MKELIAIPGDAGQARTGDITDIESLLSLGMNGDVLLLQGDMSKLELGILPAARRHSATTSTGPWVPERLGISLTDMREDGPGRLHEVAAWASGRTHNLPGRLGLRFLALEGPEPQDEPYIRNIISVSRQAGIHVMMLQNR